MATTKRNLMSAATFAAGLMVGAPALAADTPIATLVLHVHNYAQVSDRVLSDAENVASRIYAAAGVRTVWVSGEIPTASADPSVAYLRVEVLNRERAEKEIAVEQIGDNVLGRAAAPAKRAYIFYHRISEIAITHRAIVSDLLGQVLAHEVGHLLLAPGHSELGIMRAQLDPRSTVPPRFTKNQVATIHSFLASATQSN
jgi:hypothetical protein